MDEILNLIESVSEGFPTYSYNRHNFYVFRFRYFCICKSIAYANSAKHCVGMPKHFGTISNLKKRWPVLVSEKKNSLYL